MCFLNIVSEKIPVQLIAMIAGHIFCALFFNQPAHNIQYAYRIRAPVCQVTDKCQCPLLRMNRNAFFPTVPERPRQLLKLIVTAVYISDNILMTE